MTVQDKIPVWLDCDPGQDDTVAIIIGCYGKHFNLIGVSTVHGNVSLNNTTCNALRVLTAIGKTEIPVYPGEAKALDNYAEIFAADVHGTTGLNGSNLLPLPKMKPQNKNDFFPHLAKVIEENEYRINIVATGPLTNIALFFRKYPHLKEKIRWLSIMGGGFNVYNINDSSEFNYFCDPYAAKEIIEDPILGSKIIQAPLDITTKVFVSEEIQNKILDGKTFDTASNFRSMMFELIDSFNKRMLAQHLPKYEGPVIHDPVALVALLQFENITDKLGFKYDRRSYKISIDPATYGKIISVVEDNDSGTYVLTDLDVDQFWNLVLGVYRTTDQYAYMNLIPREQLINDFMNSN